MRHSQLYKSKATALSGVYQYLREHRYVHNKGTAFYEPNQEFVKIVKEFLTYCEIPIHYRAKKKIAEHKCCEQIQVRFEKFVKWLTENKQDLKTRNIYQPK